MSELSRSSRNLVIITTTIFILVTLFTIERESGLAVGYPWTFYRYTTTGGTVQYSTSSSIQPVFFIIDWLLLAAILIALNEGWKKIRR
ncbi:MAG: hypothetical protein JNJ75_03150 [Cyclobacteriaceae bacterium]|nr:hypothetical protein [Cyclobacteriaceae bacterium]